MMLHFRAAVLIALFEHRGRIYVLMTQRSLKVNSHKGEVCLPGGKSEDDDVDIVYTALRETWEEIGLPWTHLKILGLSAPTFSMSGIFVIPVIAFIPHFEDIKLRRNDDEVQSIFACPLDLFIDEDRHEPFMDVGHSFTLNLTSSADVSEYDCNFLKTLFLEPVNSVFRIFGLTAFLLVPIAVLWYDVDFQAGKSIYNKSDVFWKHFAYAIRVISSNPNRYLSSTESSKL